MSEIRLTLEEYQDILSGKYLLIPCDNCDLGTGYSKEYKCTTEVCKAMKKHYADRDSIALGQLYVDHVMALTAEGLHDKSAIAGELAYRDMLIQNLQEDRDFQYEMKVMAREQREDLMLSLTLNDVDIDEVARDTWGHVDSGAVTLEDAKLFAKKVLDLYKRNVVL